MRLLWLVLIGVSLAFGAVAQTSPSTMGVRDGNGSGQSIRVERGGDGSVASHTVPEVDGVAWSDAHPGPVEDAVTRTNTAAAAANAGAISAATGTQGDAAYSGSGNGSLIAILKAILGKQPTPIMPPAASASVALSSSPATVFSSLGAGITRFHYVLLNTDLVVDGGGGGNYCWCRWGGTPSAHGVGSFMIAPGGGFDVSGPGVDQEALQCLAVNGAPILYAKEWKQ